MVRTRIFQSIFVILALLTVGCAPTNQEKATAGYSVKGVDVVVSPAAAQTLKSLQDANGQDFAAKFERDLEASLRSSVGFDRGASPATLVVEVTRVYIPAEGARVLLAADSSSNSNFVLKDQKTGAELDRYSGVVSQTKAVRNLTAVNGIPIGALISTAVNAGNASEASIVADLVKATSLQAAAWLKQ